LNTDYFPAEQSLPICVIRGCFLDFIRVSSVFNPWLNLTLHFCFPPRSFMFILAARFWPETGVKNAVFIDYFS
jgi:hypothetical protein